MKYTVYFEIYGKKLKATVEASDEKDAKYVIMKKIIFHKVEEHLTSTNNGFDFLMDIVTGK